MSKSAQSMIDRLEELRGGPLTAGLVREVEEVLFKSKELNGDSQALLHNLRTTAGSKTFEYEDTNPDNEGDSNGFLSSPFFLPAVGGICALVGAAVGLGFIRKMKQRGDKGKTDGPPKLELACPKAEGLPTSQIKMERKPTSGHEVLDPNKLLRINSAEAFV